MDRIFECANNYMKLLNTEYRFFLSLHRKVREITLSFEETDFRHISGLHYIDDIFIEKNPHKTLSAIINKEITDELLNKSNKYKDNKIEGKSIVSRIEELVFLEEYLDKSDFIRVYEIQKFGSLIKADYFIEAYLKHRSSTVYIFIRKREQSDKYVIVSFFKKSRPYFGIKMYFMLKEKIKSDSVVVLYKNPNYSK